MISARGGAPAAHARPAAPRDARGRHGGRGGEPARIPAVGAAIAGRESTASMATAAKWLHGLLGQLARSYEATAAADGCSGAGEPAARLRDFALPVIDLSRFSSDDPAERIRLAERFDEVFSTVGVCLIKNYDAKLQQSLERLRAEAAAYFALPDEVKLRSRVDDIFGFLPNGVESVAASIGEEAPPDLVEGLNFNGRDADADGAPQQRYSGSQQGWTAERVAANCAWLNADWAQEVPAPLRDVAFEYWCGLCRLLDTMMELASLALGLPPGYFAENGYSNPGCVMRIANYVDPPATGPEDGQARYNAHTDYDGFTFLSRSPGKKGLEIQLPDGEWVSVLQPPDTLIINIGDLLAHWSNDRWKATMHRVSNPAPPGTANAGETEEEDSRLSVVFFSGPHPSTLVECLPSKKCQGQSVTPKYPPITAEQHVRKKLELAAGIRSA